MGTTRALARSDGHGARASGEARDAERATRVPGEGSPDAVATPGARASAEAGEAPGRRLSLRAHPGWIVVLAMSAILLRCVMATGLSGDVYWQLAAGKWMLAHHAIVRHDVFSYTVRGRPWLDEEWGFQVLLALCVKTIGPTAFWILPAGASIAALLVSVARWRVSGAGWSWIATLAVVAGGCLALGDVARPQVASYLLFACELLVLRLARRAAAWLVALPPLLGIWANLHGSFLAGLAVLGVELLLARFTSRGARVRTSAPLPLRSAALAFGASLAATLANPHGPALLAYAFRVSTSPALGALVEEWQSPNFHSLLLVALVLAPAAVVVAQLALGSRSFEAFDLIVWGAMLVASLHAQRFIPYLGIAWGGLEARLGPQRLAGARPSLLTGPLAAVVAGASLLGPVVPAGAGASGMPVAAVAWLAPRSGRVLSTYLWSDYLIYAGRPVFVDGRTDLYFGTPILGDWVRIAALRVDPDPILSQFRIRYVLWPARSPLAVFLSGDARWRVVHRSGDAIVFERR